MTSLFFVFVSHAQSVVNPNSKAHFSEVFTQGLIIKNNIVWESSGLYGKSLLTKWNLNTGKIIKQKKMPNKYFAEGITELNGRLYQLTWKAGVAFEIDMETLDTIKQHRYRGEGWGLTTNGKQLIMSNGSDVLQFINPETFKTESNVRVHIGQSPIFNLNELEWIKGKIWANVYQTDYIIVIEPLTGEVIDKYYLPNLLSKSIKKPGVLNGIAYDESNGKIWITGKKWPFLYEF